MNYKISYFCFILCLAPVTFLLGHFYTPERLAFPSLCEKHYTDARKNTAHTWIEPVDAAALAELTPYLKYLPKPYEADCLSCSGCGGMRLSRREEFRMPFEHSKFAYDELAKLHQQVRYGTLETCRHRGNERCDGFCWDGAYLRRLNSKYLPFFKEILVYNSQNSLCKCFWHEKHEKAVEINNFVYRFLYSLVEQKLIQGDFSPFWVSKEIRFDRKGRIYGKEYFPNSHGMASSLATYMFFYSHYQKMLREAIVSIDTHAANTLQGIVAKDQVYNALEELHAKFMPLYTHCLTIHPHPQIFLERSLLRIQVGESMQALADLLSMLKLAETEKFRSLDILTANVYLHLGEAYAALKMNEKAIGYYNKALEKNGDNPKDNREVYFRRAAAHFELGHYETAYDDYQLSEKGQLLEVVLRHTSDDFREALLRGLKRGGGESSELPIVPSGTQRAFWAFLDDVNSGAAQLFANACDEIGRAFSHGLQGGELPVIEGAPEEAIQLLSTYSLLGDSDRGERLGQLIGKYGIRLFSGGKKIKQVEAFRSIQEANYICNFSALAHSDPYREEIVRLASTYLNLKSED